MAVKKLIDFYENFLWYEYIPGIKVIKSFFVLKEKDYDVTTYDFLIDQSSAVSMLLANTRSDYGWVMVAIGQSEKTEIITWSYVTFSDILVECIA